jgi:phenylacetic acid degradation operon negative regulatory protein
MRKKRQLDDPRALRDQASGAVIFAFGASGAEARSLPGPALVAILGALGMAEGTARATILRMRRGGWLASKRRGPVVDYTLTDPARTLAASVLAPVMGPRPAWNGCYQGLLFTVPEAARGYRDALRRAATLAGFGLLQAGLLITAESSRWSRIEPLLDEAPATGRLLRVELCLSLEAARIAAAEAWPLDALATTYRRQAADVMRAIDLHRSGPLSGAAAVRAMWEVMTPISATAIDDPALPAELLPDDWPAAEIRSAIVGAGTILGPELLAFVKQTSAGSERLG